METAIPSSIPTIPDKLEDSSQQDDNGNDDPNRKKPNTRKRTKTGCLTCRRRRIKCDEGRPICNNCIKSRRNCEGYNQRVVFKSPYGPFDGSYGPATYPPVYPPGPSEIVHQPHTHAGVAGSTPQGAFPAIAPKPPLLGSADQHYPSQQLHILLQFNQMNSAGQPGGGQPIPDFPHGLANYEGAPLQPNPLISTRENNAFRMADPDVHLHFGTAQPEEPGKEHRTPAERLIGSVTSPGQTGATHQLLEPGINHELQDDEASMASSWDEDPDPRQLLLPVASAMTTGAQVRAFSTFAQSNTVFEYMHSPYAAGLKDEGRNIVFMHFINVTGPSMSLYERHPFDQQAAEEGRRDAGDHLWSSTFPIIALNHPGLLQAMLAIGSLQISKLQGTPSTAALKHYHLALRRVARNLKTSTRSVDAATLATTLLLAYFEVWSADHNKWCNHLYGARRLFSGIPLREMSRVCLPAKEMNYRHKEGYHTGETHGPNGSCTEPTCQRCINYDLLSSITGSRVTPGDYSLGGDQILDDACFFTTERDLAKYENLRDLFWWYCKMDVYQSILGGTRLFMDFKHWTQCPPRAPINTIEAIYGTYDHLMLLLGRLTNFAAKDVDRKRKAYAARSSSSMRGPPTTGSPPGFPGMIPTQGTFEAPVAFNMPQRTASSSEDEVKDSFSTAEEALQEWEGIRAAFKALEDQLGSAFSPLTPEFTDHRPTPFGTVLQFRTYSVAGIWMNYYMGSIVLHRCHPSMPPAAMQAAGVAAVKTAVYANMIGRIASGLSDDSSRLTQISTVLGAAFIESSFCLFVAAVQFGDDAQRHWVIQRMLDTTRLTGWQSALQIADGCESCWVRLQALRGGPPYKPWARNNRATDSVWDNARRIDRRIHEVEQAETPEDRQLTLSKPDQAHFALGLLGVEEDLRVLRLKDEVWLPGGSGVSD